MMNIFHTCSCSDETKKPVSNNGEPQCGRFKQIVRQLKVHAPFTIFGALTGIVIMLSFQNISSKTAYDIFYVFHQFF